MPVELLSGSEEQTSRLAAGISRLLRPGDVVLLEGQLGAGKTFFVREAARSLGVDQPVTSPSFTMARSYRGRVTVHHLDLYRLQQFDAQAEADFAPFLEPDAITFIEWPEVAVGHLAAVAMVLVIRHEGEHSRRFEIDCIAEELLPGLEAVIADISD